ncbi:MFS transporter [Leucobacter rhizosphaerae]|uniref:MFS transporter n=1 Tax=Leucobacter rhizosphaerae TaxID=2932245 RepID=A0ABY4FS11_9MICO|nr:MFS transporter [Leucobacter rhizosphaerae]UOQ59055.1 MFS transporter [Leucobacter rhizosphaerae]
MTSVPTTPTPRPWVLLFVAVCLVAANMRMTITGVGPLLDQISSDLGVELATLGALGAVPLLSWAIVSPLAHGLSARLGMERAVTVALLALIAGTVWRSLPGGLANLWLGTALIGASLAVGNVIMPALIKRDFPGRLPLVMGVYTALLGGAGAISAGVVVPIAGIPLGDGTLGWRVALLATGAAVPVALGVWVWAVASRRRASAGIVVEATSAVPAGVDPDGSDPDGADSDDTDAGSERRRSGIGRRVWRDPVAWWVALYMGTQSSIFFIMQTWLSPIEISRGYSAEAAGTEVMLLQIIGVGSSMLVPLCFRGRLRRSLPALIPVLGSLAIAGMLTVPALMILWICAIGIAAGASLTMSLTLMAVRARTAEAATSLSGMAQGVGYLIAAAGPVTFGWLHQMSGGWSLSLGLVLALCVVQVLVGWVAGRERSVLAGSDPA